MNWITNFVRPKLQAIVGKKEVLIIYGKLVLNVQMLLKRELENNFYVCKHCDFHFRINARTRLELFLSNNYIIMDTPKVESDPLKFKDTKKYSERLKDAQKKNETNDSVIVASGTLGTKKIVVAIFDFNFMGGSMGMAAGEAIIHACTHAKKEFLPLIIFSSFSGARMQEGILVIGCKCQELLLQ